MLLGSGEEGGAVKRYCACHAKMQRGKYISFSMDGGSSRLTLLQIQM